MALPATAILDGIRSLSGKARITFPDGNKRVERVARFPKDNWELTLNVADSEHTECLLTDQQKLKEDAQYVEVYRVYDKLPGTALSGVVITPEGQLGTLTRQTVAPGTSVTPSATMVSGSVQPDGAGKSVLETVTVPSVFPETQKSKSQITKIPERFFATEVTQESSVAAGTDTTPNVGTGGLGVIEQSKQAVSAFKVKTSTTTAPSTTIPNVGAVLDSWGIVQTETETIVADSVSPDTGFNVEKSDVRPIGGGKAIKSVVARDAAPTKLKKRAGSPDVIPAVFRAGKEITVTVTETASDPGTTTPDFASGEVHQSEVDQIRTDRFEKTDTTIAYASSVTGQEYDDEVDAAIPYLRTIVADPIFPTGISGTVTPLAENLYLTEEPDSTELDTVLGAISISLPVLEDIKMPDTLVEVGVDWAIDTGGSTDASQPVTLVAGANWETKYTARATQTATVTGSPYCLVKSGYKGPVEATMCTFFLKGPTVTLADVLTGAHADAVWPLLGYEEERRLVVTSRSGTVGLDGTVHNGSGYFSGPELKYPGVTKNSGNSIASLKLPEAYHEDDLTVVNADDDEAVVTGQVLSVTLADNTQSLTVKAGVSETTFASLPSPVEAKKYITSLRCQPYKKDWYKLVAVVVDTTDLL